MITDFATLKDSIKNEFARPGLDETRLEEAIQAVEVALSNEDDFVSAFLETRTASAMVTGEEYFQMPNDVVAGRPFRQIKITTPRWDLKYRSPQLMDSTADVNELRIPRYYTTIGNFLRWQPTPDSDYPIEMVYFAKIPALTSSNTVNDILTNNPLLYKWGAIADLLSYVGGKNAQRLSGAPDRFQQTLVQAISAARQRRVPRGPHRMQRSGTTV